ncbi:MAG TPA: 3'-5' exonuclease [Roseiflexaceae bacterium]|nr:3'-5' exonuclease [Roseiflexaceae bacterium]
MTPATAIPTFAWFDQIPAELRERWLTRNQLAEQGLRPARGAQMVARVQWRTGWAALYDKEQAVPKRQATEAQRTALRAAQERLAVQRRTCPACGTLFPFILPTDDDWSCPECLRQQRQEDRTAAIERAARAMADPEAVILDTETTGLDGYLVEIAVVSMAGEVLFSTRVDPECPIEPEAAKLHGITEVGLTGAPAFAQIADGLTALLAERTIWIYNKEFDASVLEREIARLALAKAQAGLLAEDLAAARRFADRCGRRWRRQSRWRCAMRLYSEFVGDWSPYHGSYRYQPLPGGDHSAAGDALATLAVLRRMVAQEKEHGLE